MRFEWELVKGHSGHEGNERCDQIAVAFTKNDPVDLYSGPMSEYSIKIGTHQKVESFDPVYLSYVDGVLSRHTTWEDCQNATVGISGAKYKKVKTSQEEQDTLKLWGL